MVDSRGAATGVLVGRASGACLDKGGHVTARTTSALAAVAPLAALLVTGTGATASGARTGQTYRNPMSGAFADTFADPAVVRAKDGWWYAYGTSDPLTEGEVTANRVPIARSVDLVDWDYVGDAFTDATLPSWAEPAGDLGAGHPLRRGRIANVLRHHRDDRHRRAERQHHRDGDRADSGWAVHRQRRPRRRSPQCRAGQLQVDLRPLSGHRHRRLAAPPLRPLLRRRLRNAAQRSPVTALTSGWTLTRERVSWTREDAAALSVLTSHPTVWTLTEDGTARTFDTPTEAIAIASEYL
jgi:hypothetical protein